MTPRRAALAMVGCALAASAWAASGTGPFAPPPLHALLDGSSLRAAALTTVLRAVGAALVFAPVGAFAVLAARRPDGSVPAARALVAVAMALAAAGGALLLWPGRAWRTADALALAAAMVGGTLGVVAGTATLAAPPARRRLGRVLAISTLVAAAAVAVAGIASLERRPMSPPAATITSAEKRRVFYLIRRANPRKVPPGDTRTLRLTARELTVLAAWAEGILGRHWRAAVALGSGSVRVSSSLPIAGGRRFLNAVLQFRPTVEPAGMAVQVEHLRVGRLVVPRPFATALARMVLFVLGRDDRLAPFLEATRAVDVTPQALSVAYTRVDLPPGATAEVFGPALAGDVDPDAVRAHARHLVDVSTRIAPGPLAVDEALRSSFAFAQARADENGAAAENRAALVALGILLGHDRLQAAVGPVLEPADWRKVGPALRRPTLRGRKDWTRHFFVSAALTALSAESVSDAAGIFKEELDADGGSGFSFGDLLADRAGTCFAIAATRDDDAARRMQERLAAGLGIEELVPPADGLPEGITDAQLERQYGGVGGTAYRRLAEAIERRLPGCAP
jgi:hypothetical protein